MQNKTQENLNVDMDVDAEAAVGHKDQCPVQLADQALDLKREEPQCQPFLEEI